MKWHKFIKYSDKEVTLKGAFYSGILLDVLIFAMANTIMDCGTTAMRSFFLILAHLVFSIWLALRKKSNLSRNELDFIR